MTRDQFETSLAATKCVSEVLTSIGPDLDHKNLTSRQLFESLYLARSLEHFQSIVLLLERELYSSALALRRVLYETYLRGMWISLCATDEFISTARKANFEISDKLLKRSKLEEELGGRARGLLVERQFYKRGNGFVHGGLHETAMYALRSNPKVSRHLFRTVHQELQNSTLRLLQVFLQFHSNLLQSAVNSERYGSSGVDRVMERIDQLKAVARQYQCAVTGLTSAPPVEGRENTTNG